jgi:hypothetical protein
MLDDLERHSHDTTTSVIGSRSCSTSLAGVTRTIDAESSGHRTPTFAAWWEGVDRSAQQTIQDVRNAEL